MNKVILMGRLTKDVEVRYTQASEPMAISKYTLAVNKRFKKDGEPDADFLNCVAFGKNGEFAEKWFKKGMQVAVVGHLQTGSYEKDGVTRYTTDIIIEEQHFAESKKAFGESKPTQSKATKGFVVVDDDFDVDSDIPF